MEHEKTLTEDDFITLNQCIHYDILRTHRDCQIRIDKLYVLKDKVTKLQLEYKTNDKT